MEQFETYQPALIKPNTITKPSVFNGMCLIRKYKVTVEEVEESEEILKQRLRHIWNRRTELRLGHSSNLRAMIKEAEKLGIKLEY